MHARGREQCACGYKLERMGAFTLSPNNSDVRVKGMDLSTVGRSPWCWPRRALIRCFGGHGRQVQ